MQNVDSEMNNNTQWITKHVHLHLSLMSHITFVVGGWVCCWLYETIVIFSHITNLSLIPYITFVVGGWVSSELYEILVKLSYFTNLSYNFQSGWVGEWGVYIILYENLSVFFLSHPLSTVDLNQQLYVSCRRILEPAVHLGGLLKRYRTYTMLLRPPHKIKGRFLQ